MALPASGPIGMGQIAAELGISAAGLSLNDSRVRALAGKPSGPISFANLHGKSAAVGLAATVSPTAINRFETVGSNGFVNFDIVVTPTGGTPGYSYNWSTNVGIIYAGQFTNHLTLRLNYANSNVVYEGTITVIVTDGASNTFPVSIPFYFETSTLA